MHDIVHFLLISVKLGDSYGSLSYLNSPYRPGYLQKQTVSILTRAYLFNICVQDSAYRRKSLYCNQYGPKRVLLTLMEIILNHFTTGSYSYLKPAKGSGKRKIGNPQKFNKLSHQNGKRKNHKSVG